jgi:hypothetical protein
MRIHTSKLAGLALCALSLVATGCGDDNDDAFINTFNPGVINNNTFGNNQFAGRYLGTTNVNGQQGTLDLSVGPNGQATGTLTFGAQQVSPRVLGVLLTGPYTFSGSVDPNTGSFLLQGELPGLGPIVMTGTLPRGNAQGSFQLSIAGQTFSGPIQNAQLGAPGPNNNGGGTPATGDTRLIFGGSSDVALSFSSFNGIQTQFSANDTVTGTLIQNSNNNLASLIVSETIVDPQTSAPVGLRSLVLAINTNGEELEVGRAYEVVNSNTTVGAIVSLQETDLAGNIQKIWTAGGSGTVTVTSITSTKMEMAFSVSNVPANPAQGANPASGTFSGTGTVSGNFAP